MGVLDKFLDVMKVNEDEDFEDDEYFEDDDPYYEDEKPARKSFLKRNSRGRASDDYDDADDDYDEPVQNTRSGGRASVKTSGSTASRSTTTRQAPRKSGSGMEVCVMRPTAVEDSRTIAETLMGNRTVVLNLEGLDLEIAQRIIDFVSGATYALDGNLQKVSQYIFLLTPDTVDISGDLNDLFGTGKVVGSAMMDDEYYE